MLGKHKFHVGQRVRPSTEGVQRGVFSGTYKGKPKAFASGEVVAVDKFNSPTVRWDYRKTATGYAPWFIEPDRRRRKRS